MNYVNLYITDSTESQSIENVEYGENVYKIKEGNIRNKFIYELLNLSSEGSMYLRTIKKDKDDKTNYHFSVKRNENMNADNYKEYVRRNGILTTQEGYILRTLDNCTDIEKLQEPWIKERNTYNNSIVNIKSYGYICKKNEEGKYDKLSCYIICEKYGDFSDVLKLCLKDSINYTKSFLKFLNIVFEGDRQDKSLPSSICVNLRLYNYGVGYYKNGDVYFVLLDFNENSILFRDKIKEKLGDSMKLNNRVGVSYIPYYIANDCLSRNKDWFGRLDKLYAIGLVELLMYLFFRKTTIFLELYLFLTDTVELPYDIQYHHVVRRYEDCRNKQTINKMIINLKLKYCELDTHLSSYLFSLLMQLSREDYEGIPYPIEIMKDIDIIENQENSYENLEKEAFNKLIKKIGYVDKLLDGIERQKQIRDIIDQDEIFNIF